MAKPKHIILTEEGVITQEALQAYAHGALSPEEVVQVEKLLREDPFALEALDGIRQNAAAAGMSTAVSAINTRLREKTGTREKKNKGIQIHWATYAYAAMVAGVLIGLGFVMVHFMQQNSAAIAMNKETPQAEESIARQEQKTEPATLTTDTAQTAKLPDQTQLTSDTTTVKLNEGVNGAVASTLTSASTSSQLNGYTQSSPPLAQAKAPAAQTNSYNPAPAADRKAAIQQITTAAAAKPVATQDKSDDDIAISVDGHDLNTGAETKSKNYKSTTPSDFEANKALNSVTVSGSKVEARKKERAETTAADQMKEARALFDAGDFKEAAKKYDKVLSSQPDNIDALFFGGISEYKNGKLKPAERNFDKLIKSGQYVDGSKWYKANVLIDRGKKDEAKVLLRELSTTSNPYKDRAVKKFEEIQK